MPRRAAPATAAQSTLGCGRALLPTVSMAMDLNYIKCLDSNVTGPGQQLLLARIPLLLGSGHSCPGGHHLLVPRPPRPSLQPLPPSVSRH